MQIFVAVVAVPVRDPPSPAPPQKKNISVHNMFGPRGGSFRRETGWKWEGYRYRMQVAKKWLTASSQILWREIAMSILFDAFLPTS